MTSPAIFDYSGQQVRTVVVDAGEPWFVAADVCRILEHTNPTAATGGLDSDERGLRNVETPSGVQQMVCVSEAGLYSLILRSRKSEARAFRRWVTHEVLPTLRRGGTVGVPTLDLGNRDHVKLLVQAGNAALIRAEEAEARVAELEPAATAWETLSDPAGDFSVREAAQVLSRDETISIGQNRLFDYLRQIHWIDQQNGPYQAQVDNGRLVRRVTDWTDDFGQRFVKVQPRITPKGLAELRKRLGDDASPSLALVPGGAA